MPANATGTYLYFAVDPTFKWNCASNLGVEVEYYDGSLGSFSLKYDGRQGAYQSTTTTLLRRSQRWQQATFKLRDIRFENLENGGADFRLWVRGGQLYVRRVMMRDDPETPRSPRETWKEK